MARCPRAQMVQSTCTHHSPTSGGYPRDGIDFQPGPALRVACCLLLKAALWMISPIGAKDAGMQVCKTVAGIDPRWSTLSARYADTGALHKKAVYAVGAPQKLRAVVTEPLPIPDVYAGLVLQFDRGLQICKCGGKAPNLKISQPRRRCQQRRSRRRHSPEFARWAVAQRERSRLFGTNIQPQANNPASRAREVDQSELH